MKFKIDFFAAIFWGTLIISGPTQARAAFLAAFLHECGHFIASKLCAIPIREFHISMLGARLITSHHLFSYRRDIILCMGGPLVNILTGALLLTVSDLPGEGFSYAFTVASFALGIVNLLPIKTLDGGRILEAILCNRLNPSISCRIQSVLSFFTIFSIWMFSVYFMIRYTSSLSLFVFSIGVFVMLFL